MLKRFSLCLVLAAMLIAMFTVCVLATDESALPELSAGENTNSDGTVKTFTWEFEESSGILTIQIGFGQDFILSPTYCTFLEWKKAYRDLVEKIVVSGRSQYRQCFFQDLDEGVFDNYPNLEAVLIDSRANRWFMSSAGPFENCPSLTTVDWGTSWSTVEYGIIDLSGITQCSKETAERMLFGCSSAEKVILPSSSADGANYASTNIYESTFSGCASLKEIIVPSTVATVSENAFIDCPSVVLALQDGSLYSNLKGQGVNCVFDLRIVALDSFNFERGDMTDEITVYLAEGDSAIYSSEALNEKFGNNVIYYVYPTSSGADAVRELIKTNETVTMVYYPELPREGSESSGAKYSWTFDEFTGVLTINTYGSSDFIMSVAANAFYNWKVIWRDAIVRIQVTGQPLYRQVQFSGTSEGAFDHLPNLEAVLINLANRFQANPSGFFEGCTSLTTLDWGTSWNNVEWGVIDLSGLSEIYDRVNTGMFAGCSSIKKVKLEGAPVTKLLSNIFKDCTSLEYIHIPSNITTVESDAFSGCEKLIISTDTAEMYKTLKGYGLNVAIDLRAGALSGVELAAYGEEVGNKMTVFLPSGINEELTDKALSEKFGTNVTYYVYPTSTGAEAVRQITDDSVNMVYYSEIFDPSLARSGEETVGSKYDWSFDENTGILTVNTSYSEATGGEFVMSDSSNAFYNWKTVWRDAIIKIQISGNPRYDKMQFVGSNEGAFENLPNLEAVLMTSKCNQWAISTGGLFENCKSLTTFDWGTNWDGVEWGVIDLTGATNVTTLNSVVDMFKCCSSINKVIFSTGTDKTNYLATHIAEGMFSGCSSLESITVPTSVISIAAGAFENCDSLKFIVLENSDLIINDPAVFPDRDGFYVLCASDASAEAITEAYESTVGITLDGIVDADGFQVRFTGLNGLRGIFYADELKIDELESKGFKVTEYGALVSSANEYNSRGGICIGKVEGEYITNGDLIKKLTVWNGEKYVGKVLSTTTEARTDYAVTVVNFTNNYSSEVYMCAYAVITDPYGNDYIVYENYGEKAADFEFVSLYGMTVAMYKDESSPIHSETLGEKAIWNTIIQGAVMIGSAYENLVAENVSFVLAKDGEGYIGFLRSMTDIDAITDEALEAAMSIIPEGFDVSAIIETVIAGSISLDTPTVDAAFAYPNTAPLIPTYSRENDEAQHCQGFCTDGEYMYYSLTGFIIKTDMEGNEIGRVHAYNKDNGNPGIHLGAITYHEGYIYVPINYMWWGVNYIGVIDIDDFVDSDPETEGIQAVGREAINILYTPELHDKEFRVTLEDGSTQQLFRNSGIGAVTVGKLPGGGYISESGEMTDDNNYYAIIAHDIVLNNSNIYYDDDYKMFSVYDISDIESKLINIDEIDLKGEGMEQTAKYVFRAYTGASQYGVQNLEYDKDTGDYWLWCYGRPNTTDHLSMNFFVMDGSKKLKMETLEVGQSVSSNSSAYNEASRTVALYIDENGEFPKGYVATLKCICGKGDIDNHDAICYGESGYGAKICGFDTPIGGSQGFCYLGKDYFYAGESNNSTDANGYTIYGTNANLYRVNRKLGKWSFIRIE